MPTLFVKGAKQLEKNIRNDRHRNGAILIRDHVIDHYLNHSKPHPEHLIKYLVKNLPTKKAPSERTAMDFANDDNPHGYQVASESDIRRGVKMAYRELEEMDPSFDV